MNTEFYSFGEILWDCLPSGRHAGGAPFNVTAHLVQLGSSASLISAIGNDPLGDEILKVAEDKGVNTGFVTRARAELATGTVLVTVDANGNASYDIVQPVAWDEIKVLPETLDAVSQARGFIYGSLAGRSPYNLEQVNRLLALDGPVKFFDVNLRPPFAHPALVIDLAKHADVIKLNDDEVGKLATWLKTGEASFNTPNEPDELAQAWRLWGKRPILPAFVSPGLRRAQRSGTTGVDLRQRSAGRRQGYRRRGRLLHGRSDDWPDARWRCPESPGRCLPRGCLRRLARWSNTAAAAGDCSSFK